MQLRLLIFLYLASAMLSRAEEKLPVLKTSSETYSNITVTSYTATDVYFKFRNSETNAKIKDLETPLQRHFRYDAVQANAAEKRRQAEDARYVFRAGNATNRAPENIADRQLELDSAIARVKAIVNQPARKFQTRPGLHWGMYPYWFHEGATMPDFRNVDVRTTQELPYAKDAYVSSSLNPGTVWAGSEIEFNSMTKYFITDRTLPKRRLSEAEMLEINRLYRIIGEDQKALKAAKIPDRTATAIKPVAALPGQKLQFNPAVT